LVIREWQTGSKAPTQSFQSAAPSFSVVDCFDVKIKRDDGIDIGHWNTPTPGQLIGQHRGSVPVEYWGNRFEGQQPWSYDFDVQPASADKNDASSWKPVRTSALRSLR
jgi:hypothetical protein